MKLKLVRFFSDFGVKTIMFTGPGLGIGTSTVASNFALMLSTDYRLRVLLMNTDYRSLYENELFTGVSNVGLSDVLTKNCTPKSAFHKSKQGNLYLLPKGKTRLRPTSLLESPQFTHLLEFMRERFDYLILDAPPVIGYSDSQIIATKVDGVILVIESGKTRRQAALRAKQELEDVGSKVLGVVLNKRQQYIPAWIYRRL
jgi:capsular exopolysaccharide synthesis family protein